MSRLLDLFLEPAAATEPALPPAIRTPQLTAVLAPATELSATAGGTAAAIRRTAKTRTAVVLRPGAVAPRSAFPAAAALARRLAARELPAVAAGTLCHVALPSDPAPCMALVARVLGAADVPLVLALPSRPHGLDGLLAQADRLVLALPGDTTGDLAELALTSLAALGPPVIRVAPPTGFLTARAAALGLVVLALPGPAHAGSAPPAVTPEPPEFAPPRHPDFDAPRAGVRV